MSRVSIEYCLYCTVHWIGMLCAVQYSLVLLCGITLIISRRYRWRLWIARMMKGYPLARSEAPRHKLPAGRVTSPPPIRNRKTRAGALLSARSTNVPSAPEDPTHWLMAPSHWAPALIQPILEMAITICTKGPIVELNIRNLTLGVAATRRLCWCDVLHSEHSELERDMQMGWWDGMGWDGVSCPMSCSRLIRGGGRASDRGKQIDCVRGECSTRA